MLPDSGAASFLAESGLGVAASDGSAAGAVRVAAAGIEVDDAHSFFTHEESGLWRTLGGERVVTSAVDIRAAVRQRSKGGFRV